MGFIETIEWTAVSSAFSAVCIAAYGLYKAVVKLVQVLNKKKG